MRRMLRHVGLWSLGLLALVLIACGSEPVVAPDPTAASTATLPTVTPNPLPTPTTVPAESHIRYDHSGDYSDCSARGSASE